MKYYTRLILYPDGSSEKVKVSKKEADRFWDSLLKEDKEILDILKKL